jgi:type IV secretion system protein VirD4
LRVPVLSDVEYPDKPNARKDDWSGQVRKIDERLSGADRDPSVSGDTDEGGMQQQRHPSLPEEQKRVEPGLTQADLPGLLDEDSEVVADKRVIDRLAKPTRVYGLNEALGPDRDLLDGF